MSPCRQPQLRRLPGRGEPSWMQLTLHVNKQLNASGVRRYLIFVDLLSCHLLEGYRWQMWGQVLFGFCWTSEITIWYLDIF